MWYNRGHGTGLTADMPHIRLLKGAVMKAKLTHKQQEVYDYILSFTNEYG